MLVTALPRFRHLQKFFRASRAVALQSYSQPVWRILGLEAVLLPRERPVQPARPLAGIGFLRKKIPLAQVHAHFATEKILRCSLRRGSFQRGSRQRFLNSVIVSDNLSSRAYPHIKLFLLPRPEKARVPIPDVQLAGHQLVGLR